MLNFGFPCNYAKDVPPQPTYSNHASAVHYAEHISSYINEELSHKAMIGPMQDIPFEHWCQVNTLMTKEKKRMGAILPKRRAVVDL